MAGRVGLLRLLLTGIVCFLVSSLHSVVGECPSGFDGPTCQRRNVALHRTAEQSSTGEYELPSNSTKIPFGAQYAVDGIVGYDLFTTPCTHTDESDSRPYWSVTLDQVYGVFGFRIYNRAGQFARRLNGFTLSVGNNTATSSYTTCYQDLTTSVRGPGDKVERTCQNQMTIFGNMVRISLNSNDPLTLCEVQIFVCSAGSWGDDCGKYCGHCWDDNPCLQRTGSCPTNDGGFTCNAGFHGAQCNTECDDSHWGPDCGQSCGHCWNNLACNKSSGVCPVGTNNLRCSSGYLGDKCTTECPDGRYGANCSVICGNCAQGRATCNKTTGECPLTTGGTRCQAGYGDTVCKTECLEGTWGEDCSNNCSRICIDSSCNAQSGTCTSGCLPGHEGSICDTGKQDGQTVGGIVGGVVGAMFVIACVIIVVVLFLRRRRKKPTAGNGRAEFDGKLEDLKSSKYVTVMSSEEEIVNYVDSNPYENTADSTGMIPIDTFGSYLAEKIAAKELITEFESFKVGLNAKHESADRPENQGKSRYKRLLAYDHSRVKLKAMPEPTSTDYINASYINGYNEPKKYIASQGPTTVMINDFMLMIWERDAGKVVMLTNLVENTKQKCLQYWPDEGSSQFGVIKVTCAHVQMYADFVIRTLELTNSMEKGKTKIVTLFHFTSWPDHGTPIHPTGLLDFRDKVKSYPASLNGPTVVHCSAGVGRTGTYIALDYLINQAKQSGKVNVPVCVTLLREQRVNMVQTQDQYDFIHHALLEAIQLSHTCIPCVDFSTVYADLCLTDPHSKETKLNTQFRVLGDLTPSLSESSLATARHLDNQAKNRYPDILAADSSRPFLSSRVPGGNDYINAVFLPSALQAEQNACFLVPCMFLSQRNINASKKAGVLKFYVVCGAWLFKSYKMKRAFIITQMTLPNTVVDFWRLVYEQGVSTIVMLNTADDGAKDDGLYWPDKSGQFGPFAVEEVEVNEYDGFSVFEYQLAYRDRKINLPIKQFRCKFWPRKPCPKSPTVLLTLIEHVEQWRKETGNKPVIVHCRDGVSKSGVYCAASAIIERLVEDKDVNIVQMVKQLRIHRPQIITGLEQFDFLHRVVIEYLNVFQTYSNFM